MNAPPRLVRGSEQVFICSCPACSLSTKYNLVDRQVGAWRLAQQGSFIRATVLNRLHVVPDIFVATMHGCKTKASKSSALYFAIGSIVVTS